MPENSQYPQYFINYERNEAVRFDDDRHLTKVKSYNLEQIQFSENGICKNVYQEQDAIRIRAGFSPCTALEFNALIISIHGNIDYEYQQTFLHKI